MPRKNPTKSKNANDAPATKGDVQSVKNNLQSVKSDISIFNSYILDEIKNVESTLTKSIDDLTIIVGNAFQKVEKRFDEMDKKIDDKIEGVNSRIEGVHRRLDAHDLECVRRDEFNRLEKRVKVLETD